MAGKTRTSCRDKTKRCWTAAGIVPFSQCNLKPETVFPVCKQPFETVDSTMLTTASANLNATATCRDDDDNSSCYSSHSARTVRISNAHQYQYIPVRGWEAPPSDTTTTAVSHSGDAPTTLVDAIMEMSKNIKEMNEKIKDISARLEALEMASSGRQPVPNSNVATLPETRASKDELHATPVQVTLQSGDSVNSSLHGSNIANAGSSGEHTVVTLSSTGSESDRKPSAVVLTAEAVAGHNLNPHSEVVGTTAMITGHSMARREDASRAHAAGDGSSSGVAYGNANDLLNPIPIGQSDEGQESVGKNSTPDEASSDEK